jgi:peptide chain release factor 1
MFDPSRFGELELEYQAVLSELSQPNVATDRKRFLELSRRLKAIEPIIRAVRELSMALDDAAAARELVEGASPADRELARSELEIQESRVAELEEHVGALLIPRDQNDGRNVIVTIRGAEGGAEANLFARDLFNMYQRYADRHHWKVDVLSVQESSLGGIDEATFVVKGGDAWSHLKHEGGTHRVQRVPVTESQGRVHTSSATVTVLPEADEVDVDIDPADLRIDVYRSTGPGGQSVNTTDSAVRITHVPTGLVVAMQDEKSQIQNRAKAMQVLRSRLMKLEQDRIAEERARETREQIGAGGRADKIRTYNFKENRVTDHRIGLTLHRLDKILEGDLDELVEALMHDEQSRELNAAH